MIRELRTIDATGISEEREEAWKRIIFFDKLVTNTSGDRSEKVRTGSSEEDSRPQRTETGWRWRANSWTTQDPNKGSLEDQRHKKKKTRH